MTRPNCDNCELLRGDEVVNVLAMAARGELPVCHECERLATLRAEEDDAVYCACDEHRGDYAWQELPHAPALRAAMHARLAAVEAERDGALAHAEELTQALRETQRERDALRAAVLDTKALHVTCGEGER